MIDLHIHSTASDGSLSPREVVRAAEEAGLAAAALTDHDTLAGVPEALEEAALCGLTLVPGIEMSCVYGRTEIHILGYFADPDDPAFEAELASFRALRNERNETILDNLAEDGIVLTREDLAGSTPDAVITRAHFARALKEKGVVRTEDDAFRYYLSYGGRYVPYMDSLSPERVLSCFGRYGVWPCLAHPVKYGLTDRELKEMVADLCALGLRGLEVWHPAHTLADTARLQTLARTAHLVATGGSDFHGDSSPGVSIGTGRGRLMVSDRVLDLIRRDAGK